ncbi:Methyltransferase domain-containing protein [Methylobacterium sp. 275MFSha3.1]|uniref:methyltransferase domain-containing protein n=1 Tax=Methylobacterium sp. 275MFSha3.1 TaxID=1502746 RepID=UPI0008A75D64|nr:methyltransferase domain-containing protein [Methylobacterium sp. 275MFSha3.1]SEI15108.1 Methyltransferase domain-containing protein [Methylobacterium sp. 275MFSha3.1]
MQNVEIASFQGVWPGGYQEGYPQDPLSQSSYSGIDQFNGYANQHEIAAEKGIKAQQIGYLSTLYVTYLMCIRNQTRGKVVLEIGPGRGAWSRCILADGAKHLYALDAVSAEDNNFFGYVGTDPEVRDRVTYDQVQDFSCACVPDGGIDFFFSFGCFCHLSRNATAAYFDAIARKMAPGARGYIMISDYAKLAAALAINESARDYDRPRPGRWYNLGLPWFREIIEARGFTVLDPDIGCNLRDPVVHFAKL